MNESDNNLEGQQEDQRESSYTDSYVSESSADIYSAQEVVEETEAPVAVVDTHGLFSGNQQQNAGPYNTGFGYPNYGGQPPYGDQAGGGYGDQTSSGNQTPYGAQMNSGQNLYGNQNPYGNQNGSYGEQSPYVGQSDSYASQPPYGGQFGYGDQTSYNGQPPYVNQTIYDKQPGGYGGQVPYANQPGGYGGQMPYANQPGSYGGQVPYANQPGAYAGQSPYGNQPGYGGQAYSNGHNPYSSQPTYGNQAGGGYGGGGQPPFGGQPPYDNPYSPYAMPSKKQNTGLIVGIVVAIIILFLVAVFALASRAVKMLSEKQKEDIRRDVYDFDDDYDYDYNYHDDYDYDYDYEYELDDDYFFNDYGYGYGYPDEEYDDRYYSLQQDIKDDLSYQMELTEYEYETDYDNVLITATVPVISGEDVPNLDKLNEEIRKEVGLITELFEKEYETHIKEDEDSYFGATLAGYVTYMDEDKLSIAYQEELYNDMGGGVYLISVNIDMKSGVILDNEEMLTTDDKFSVDFRKRSDEQNGEIEYLYYMTDQQITEYFNSENIIVFYTPKGMEIGFNYEEGWVTVTYEDYEQYLKVF